MEQKKVNIIHYIIVAAFCLLFRFIPGFAGITPLGMGILGSFIGAIYGWITIDMLWPSLMALCGVGLSIGMNQMLAASFGNMAVVALVLCMGVLGISMTTGAFNWLVQVMLNNKFMNGKAWLTIFKQVGLQKNDKLVVFMYLGIAYCLMMGQILFPFISTGLTLVMAYGAMFPDNPIDIVPYLLYMVVVGVAMATVYVLLMRFVFRVDASPIANFKTEGGVPAATREQKIALSIFVLFIVLMLAQSLPLGPVKAFLGKFGLIGLTLILGCVCALLKDSEGKPLCNLEKMFHMCNWGQVTMVGYIMVCATYMNTPDTGISTAMAALIKPFAALPPLVFIVVALALGVVLTNVANNMIVCVLIMPFMVNFGMSIGMAPTAMVALLFFMAQFAIATPAASPVTAVAMTQEMADANVMTKAALKIIPLLFICGLLIGWPVGQIIFG